MFCLRTQQKNLPHVEQHFDSVPSLSRDSDVGDLPVDLVHQAMNHRCSELAKLYRCVTSTRITMRSFW